MTLTDVVRGIRLEDRAYTLYTNTVNTTIVVQLTRTGVREPTYESTISRTICPTIHLDLLGVKRSTVRTHKPTPWLDLSEPESVGKHSPTDTICHHSTTRGVGLSYEPIPISPTRRRDDDLSHRNERIHRRHLSRYSSCVKLGSTNDVHPIGQESHEHLYIVWKRTNTVLTKVIECES